MTNQTPSPSAHRAKQRWTESVFLLIGSSWLDQSHAGGRQRPREPTSSMARRNRSFSLT